MPKIPGAIIAVLFLFTCSVYGAFDLTNAVEEIQNRSYRDPCHGALNGPNSDILLVVGLGNFDYGGTRHNMGVEVLERLIGRTQSSKLSVNDDWLIYQAESLEQAKEYFEFTGASSPQLDGLSVRYRVGGELAFPRPNSTFDRIVFVKPYYDINESGHFVSALVKALNLKPEQVVVLVDDIQLKRNQVKLVVGNVDGKGDGHNGLRSINKLLGFGNYFRVRLGVSTSKAEVSQIKEEIKKGIRPQDTPIPPEESLIDWVLGKIPEEDQGLMFSEGRLELYVQLILNLHKRLTVPEKERQKLVGQGSLILKQINDAN